MKLGLENKRQTMLAAILGVVGLIAFSYQAMTWFGGSPTSASSAEAAAPAPHAPQSRPTGKPALKLGKKPMVDSLDPTLRLDLLAASEKTQYEGNGRNIFVSQPDDVVIPKPITPGVVGGAQGTPDPYHLPSPPPLAPIPLKFYGFASSPGEPKRVFLKLGEDVFVAGEGEIVDRRYKVVRISNTSVQIQDEVNSGPPQSIPLTQG